MRYAIGLGANLGSRENYLQAGLELLAGTQGCRVIASSALFESEPVGPPQPRYLNAAARIEIGIDPHALLARLLAIEQLLGRERRERWGARTLDLDILWADQALDSPDLHIPHPRLTQRWFALVPLLQVAPELVPELAPSSIGLPMAGRRLHDLVLEPRADVQRAHDRLSVRGLGLDATDALASALSAAGRSCWPGLTCRDCSAQLLRVRAPFAQQPAGLLAELQAHVVRGFGFARVLISARDEHELEARVLGAVRAAGVYPFERALFAVTGAETGVCVELPAAPGLRT